MDLGKLFPTAVHQRRAMKRMRAEHADWVKNAALGVWWTVEPVGEDLMPNLKPGQGEPYYACYRFVKRAQPWPHTTECLITDKGRVSWNIWFRLGGTGFTQERGNRRTYPELMADYEATYGRDSARMQREIAERLERERDAFRAPSLV